MSKEGDRTRSHRTRRARRLAASLAMVAVAAGGLAAPAGGQSWGDDWCAETDLRRNEHCEVRAMSLSAPDARFAVNAGPNGGIRVEGWNGSEVRVLARVVTRSGSESAARGLAEEVDVRGVPGGVSSEGPRTRRGDSWSVSFRVLVPEGTALDLQTANGGITVAGVRGAVEARTTNGGLRLEDTAGAIRARTTNGGITATVSRPLGAGDSLELRTTNGSIRLGLPDGISARLEAATTNGSISTDFPVTVQGRIGRRLSATLGDGGPEVRATTTNGSIRLSRN